MNWISLVKESTIEEIKKNSHTKPVVIFKHSTRCSISATALNRLNRTWKKEEIKDADIYYLDLISYRNISNSIEDTFDVEHESPQILLIEDGMCTYHTSHLGINFEDIKKRLSSN